MKSLAEIIVVILVHCSVIAVCRANDAWCPPALNGWQTGAGSEMLPDPKDGVNFAGDSTPGSIDPADVEMSSRGGARVSVYLHDGTMVFGDLVVVGSGALTVYVYKDLSLVYDRSLTSGTHDFDYRDIDRIVIKGRSRMLQGLFIGFLGGMLTGSVVSRVTRLQSPAADLVGPGGLGGIGLLAGGTVGCLISGRDIEISSFRQRELMQLKSLCGRPDQRVH